MWLVVEVDADDGRVSRIAGGQHGQIADPFAFGIRGRVPEARGIGAVARLGAVMIEEDLEPDLAGVAHDLVHDLQTILPLQVRVFVEVDAIGSAPRIEELIAVGEADRVEAERLHLIHHLLVAAGPQAMRREV